MVCQYGLPERDILVRTSGLLHRIGDGAEHGALEEHGARLLGVDASDDVGAILNSLLSVETAGVVSSAIDRRTSPPNPVVRYRGLDNVRALSSGET